MERVRMRPEVYEAAKFGNLRSPNLEDGEYHFYQTTLKGNNILHVAAQYKQVNFSEHLLQCSLEPSLLWQGNYEGDTPLHIAAKVGSTEVVRVFTDMTKSLYWVAEKEQVDAHKELLRKPNLHKDTALHYAIRGGHHMVVKLLTREDPQLCDIPNVANESLLYLAVHKRRSDIIELILNALPSSFSYNGPKGLTALHAAVHLSLPSWEKILESRPEVIREGDEMGWTPLHHAAFFGKVRVVRLLLQHDTSVAYCLDKKKESALHIAAFRGHINIIDELVRSCPDACDMINTKGQTALHAAVIGGQPKAIKHILGMPNLVDLINEQDTEGNTALHLATLHRKHRIVIMLGRDKRVDRFATNKDHLTALDIFYDRKEVNFITPVVIWALRGSSGSPSIQGEAVEYVKMRSDEQFYKQPAEPITQGSHTLNQENSDSRENSDFLADSQENSNSRENSDSPLKSIIEIEQVVAAFIATATFAAAFTMPGGYNNDGPNQGMATLAGRTAFKTFVVANSIAFSFSAMAIFLQFDTSLSSDRRKKRIIYHVASYICIAMLGMVLAFASGMHVVLTSTPGLAVVPPVLCGFLVIACFWNSCLEPESSFVTVFTGAYALVQRAWRNYGI